MYKESYLILSYLNKVSVPPPPPPKSGGTRTPMTILLKTILLSRQRQRKTLFYAEVKRSLYFDTNTIISNDTFFTSYYRSYYTVYLFIVTVLSSAAYIHYHKIFRTSFPKSKTFSVALSQQYLRNLLRS